MRSPFGLWPPYRNMRVGVAIVNTFFKWVRAVQWICGLSICSS